MEAYPPAQYCNGSSKPEIRTGYEVNQSPHAPAFWIAWVRELPPVGSAPHVSEHVIPSQPETSSEILLPKSVCSLSAYSTSKLIRVDSKGLYFTAKDRALNCPSSLLLAPLGLSATVFQRIAILSVIGLL